MRSITLLKQAVVQAHTVKSEKRPTGHLLEQTDDRTGYAVITEDSSLTRDKVTPKFALGYLYEVIFIYP